MSKIRKLIADEQGQALVEFSLVFCVYMTVVFMLIIYGGWLYNNFQADRAARHGAVYISTTGDAVQARAVVQNYLAKTMVFSHISNITVGSGSAPTCQVQLEMNTFFPGIPKILDARSPMWVDKVRIVREATAPSEDKFKNRSNYN